MGGHRSLPFLPSAKPQRPLKSGRRNIGGVASAPWYKRGARAELQRTLGTLGGARLAATTVGTSKPVGFILSKQTPTT